MKSYRSVCPKKTEHDTRVMKISLLLKVLIYGQPLVQNPIRHQMGLIAMATQHTLDNTLI